MLDMFSDVEAVPAGSIGAADDDVIAPDGGTMLWCEAGQHQFTHTGRGRKPKDCPEHKVRNASTGVVSRRGSTKRLDGLTESTTSFLMKIGLAASMRLPVTGVALTTRAPITAAAIVEILKDNTKALNVLEKICQVVPATDIGETLAMVTVGAMVDTQRISPMHFAAQATGITQIFDQVHPGELARIVANEGSVIEGGPPRFVPVG